MDPPRLRRTDVENLKRKECGNLFKAASSKG
jgi:hypothetical protein